MTSPSEITPGSPAWRLEQVRKAEKGARAARELAGLPPIPPIVCLCGSTRFYEVFREANLKLTLAGEIVLSIGCDTKSDGDLAATDALGKDPEQFKADLDALHRRKIDLADRVVVVSDSTGYFGESTAGEIRYAIEHGKPVEFANPASLERARDLLGLLP